MSWCPIEQRGASTKIVAGRPSATTWLEVLVSEWTEVLSVIEDDQAQVEATLRELCDSSRPDHCSLVITTGGTGPAARDVTPEATEAVLDKPLLGFGELMRKVSLEKVPTAILSRQTAGIRGSSLIVNLSRQPRAIAECLDAVFPAIPYCIDLIGGSLPCPPTSRSWSLSGQEEGRRVTAPGTFACGFPRPSGAALLCYGSRRLAAPCVGRGADSSLKN